MTRRWSRHNRVNGFPLLDDARAASGDLVGDRSDEPRMTVDQAVEVLAAATSPGHTESVLALVRGRDRRRVIRRADAVRAGRSDRARGAGWSGESLRFGDEVEF